MKGAFFLDVVVGQRTAILQLLPRKIQSLLVKRNAFYELDLPLHNLDGVGGLHNYGYRPSIQSLDEDTHESGAPLPHADVALPPNEKHSLDKTITNDKIKTKPPRSKPKDLHTQRPQLLHPSDQKQTKTQTRPMTKTKTKPKTRPVTLTLIHNPKPLTIYPVP